MSYKLISYFFISLLILASEANSACNCGSTDQTNPCTGQSISITVTADTPNGGTAVDNVYNWSFNSGGGDARCGQFANGDYWIAPAVGQSTVTITGISSAGIHSSLITADADPITEINGILDGGFGNYSATENIIPSLPISYAGINSIVAAIERDETIEGLCEHSPEQCIDSYNVVTILPTVPALAGAETIRPNITGESKELLDFDDFDFSRLPAKSYLVGTDTNGLELIRKRWAHHTEIFSFLNTVGPTLGYFSEAGIAFRASALVDDFGAGVGRTFVDDLVKILSDDHLFAEKKQAVASMLSYALDMYHTIYDAPVGYPRYFGSGGAQHSGKFNPPLFLASLAIDTKYATNIKTAASHAHDSFDTGPQEISNLHIGDNGLIWGDEVSYTGIYYQGAYWDSLWKSQCYNGALGECDPNYGAKTQVDPYRYIDGPPNKPGTGYMSNNLGPQESLVALMFMMPEMCEIVNYEGLISYVDRVKTAGIKAANDPCVTPDSREEIGGTCDPFRNTGCLYYGVTWGPITPTDPTSACITTATPPYTQVGRFTSVDGGIMLPTYNSVQISNNWTTIRENGLCRYGSKRYAVRAVTNE